MQPPKDLFQPRLPRHLRAISVTFEMQAVAVYSVQRREHQSPPRRRANHTRLTLMDDAFQPLRPPLPYFQLLFVMLTKYTWMDNVVQWTVQAPVFSHQTLQQRVGQMKFPLTDDVILKDLSTAQWRLLCHHILHCLVNLMKCISAEDVTPLKYLVIPLIQRIHRLFASPMKFFTWIVVFLPAWFLAPWPAARHYSLRR